MFKDIRDFGESVQSYFLTCNHILYVEDARRMDKYLEKDSVDLLITSPPYWDLKQYSNDLREIGINQNYLSYLDQLKEVFTTSIKIIKPGGRICINVGERFIPASQSDNHVFEVRPIPADLIYILTRLKGIIYLGTIMWQKVSQSNTAGGGKIMGSYPFPPNGYFFTNREFILIFRKAGKQVRPLEPLYSASRLSKKRWRTCFVDTWKIPPASQANHIAQFPVEIPLRLILMYSYVGSTILDPFSGSGTSMLAAQKLGRNSIGFEIGFQSRDNKDWLDLVREKVNISHTDLFYQPTAKIAIENQFKIIQTTKSA